MTTQLGTLAHHMNTRQDTKLLQGTHKIGDEAVGWGEAGWMKQQRKQGCKWHNPWHTTRTLPRCSLTLKMSYTSTVHEHM